VPVLVVAGDRDNEIGRLDLMVSLDRELVDGDLGLYPSRQPVGPLTRGACSPL
jgi:hypothetical protein